MAEDLKDSNKELNITKNWKLNKNNNKAGYWNGKNNLKWITIITEKIILNGANENKPLKFGKV